MSPTKFLQPGLLALALMPLMVGGASAAADPTGVWMNDTGRGAVEIKNCGGNLCGNVVWVKNSADSKGCGKQVIGDVAPVGGGVWDNGWVYSPEKGRKYDVEITPLNDGTLRVKGYAGMKFLSKTMIWKRAPQDLQRCDQTEAKADTPKADTTTTAAPDKASEDKTTETKAADETADTDTPAKADTAKTAKKADTPAASEKADANTDEDTAKNNSKEQETASADDNNEEGNDLGKTLNGMGLDKVLTRTKSGKCKLNTPWFHVTLNCKQQ